MSMKFNPFTGTLDIVSKEPIVAGTIEGQFAYWDDTLKKWTYADADQIKWNETTGYTELDGVQFDTSFTPVGHSEGLLHWNADDGTLEIGLSGGDVNLQIGQEVLLPRGKALGSDITNGQVVYISGASGSRPELSLAKADSSATSMDTIAMATEDISENSNGYYTAFGLVRDIPVSVITFDDGDVLYLSATTAGAFTNVKPSAPNMAIKLGHVIRAHNTEGIIFININPKTNSYEDINGLTAGVIPYADENGFLSDSTSSSINEFTLQNEYNGPLRSTLINSSTGTNAMSSMTVRNDAGYRMSMNMSGTNHTFLPPNSAILYNVGYGDMGFVTDGSKDFIWYTDPTDSHVMDSINHEMMRLSWDGRLTIGTGETTQYPLQLFSLFGYGANFQGGINVDLVPDPATPLSVALTTGGSIDIGTHYYSVTYTTLIGETHANQIPTVIITDATNNAVNITNIPISTDPRVTGRKLYRTKANATNDTGMLLAVISDNTTTTYFDYWSDASLTGNIFGGYYRPNTTNRFLTVGDQSVMVLDENRTAVGFDSCPNLDGDSFITNFGFLNLTVATSPSNIVCIGSRNLLKVTTANTLHVVGELACRYNTTGGYSCHFGSQVSFYNQTGSLNTSFGHSTLRGTNGYSQTGCTAFGYNAGRTIAGAAWSGWFGYACGYTANQKLDVAYSDAFGGNSWTDADYQMAYGGPDVVEHIFRAGEVKVNGAVSKPIATKTANYTLDSDDYTIVVDASSNTVTITLPTIAGIEGRLYNIKCIDSTYTVTVDGSGSETIDGELTQTLGQWDNMKIQAYSSGWLIL